MRRRLPVALLAGVAAAAVSAVAAPRAGAPTRPDPAAFVERLVVQMVRDDYAHAWLALHPAHQAVARRWEYAFCELRTPIPGHVASLRVVQVADAIASVPGVGRVPGKAVTFRLVLRAGGLGDVTVIHTSHIVSSAGRWRWILTPDRYALYRADGCPAGLPSA